MISGLGTAPPPGTNSNGASLIVFFNDGNPANNRDVVIFDGNDSNQSNVFDADGWNVTLAGINYTSGTAALGLHVADGQEYPEDALILNGSTLVPAGAIFQGNSVPSANNGPLDNGSLWDIRSFDVTSYLSPGPNTLALTTVRDGLRAASHRPQKKKEGNRPPPRGRPPHGAASRESLCSCVFPGSPPPGPKPPK